MARKTLVFTVSDEGRDLGKSFLITEMAASKVEKMAMRCFMLIARSGIDVPKGYLDMGFVGLIKFGFENLSKVPFDDIEPILEDLFTCVQIMPNPNNRDVVRGLIEDDVEEISTRLRLRIEIIKLHADFFPAAAL